jgi:hypothetical protein
MVFSILCPWTDWSSSDKISKNFAYRLYCYRVEPESHERAVIRGEARRLLTSLQGYVYPRLRIRIGHHMDIRTPKSTPKNLLKLWVAMKVEGQ